MRNRRVLIVAGFVVVTAAVVLAIGPRRVADAYSSWASSLQESADEVPAAAYEPSRAVPGGEGILFVVTDESGAGVAYSIVTTAAEGPGVLTVVPAPLYDLLPGYGIFPLSDAMAFEGEDLALVSASNALGVRLDGAVAVSTTDLSTVLDDGVVVDLANPLLAETEEGDLVRIAAEGELARSGEVLAALFAEAGDGDQLALLERQAAAWEGVVRYLAANATVADRLVQRAGGDTALLVGILAAIASGELEITVVPVDAVGSGEDEGFETAEDEVAAFVARRLPHLALYDGPRPRAEILNGNGRLQTTRSVAEVLVRSGYRVVRTDNAENFDFDTTIVIAQGRENADAAGRAVTALGTGELRLELRAPSGIIDVSIIVGKDVPAGEG